MSSERRDVLRELHVTRMAQLAVAQALVDLGQILKAASEDYPDPDAYPRAVEAALAGRDADSLERLALSCRTISPAAEAIALAAERLAERRRTP